MSSTPRRALRRCAAVLAGLAAALCLSSQTPDRGRPYTVALFDQAPFYSSRDDRGIDRELVAELRRRSGCPLSVHVMTRSRALRLLESGAVDIALSQFNAGRLTAFSDFIPYYGERFFLLVGNAARATSVADFADRPNLRLGLIRGGAYGAKANEFVQAMVAANRVSFASRYGLLFDAMAAGQIQGMIVTPADLSQRGRMGPEAQATIIDFDDEPVKRGILLSRRSMSEPTRRAWRALVEGVLADGAMQRIYDKFFGEDLSRRLAGRP